jgi:putative redox protein
MATNLLTSQVTLIDDKVRFSGTTRNNPAVFMDYFPPIGGGEGYTGLEMLLITLSGCSATAIAVLLRKMKKAVKGLKVDATGERQETPPFAFSKIHLHFMLNSPDVKDSDLEQAISQAEKSMCPVWAMLKGNVVIEVTYEVIGEV